MKKVFLALTAMVLSIPAFAINLDCSGTEPFWNASVKNNIMTVSDPTLDTSAKLRVLSVNQAAGFTANNIMVVKTKYSRLTVVAGDCNDGMSEETYSHHAVLERDGIVFGGCCNLK